MFVHLAMQCVFPSSLHFSSVPGYSVKDTLCAKWQHHQLRAPVFPLLLPYFHCFHCSERRAIRPKEARPLHPSAVSTCNESATPGDDHVPATEAAQQESINTFLQGIQVQASRVKGLVNRPSVRGIESQRVRRIGVTLSSAGSYLAWVRHEGERIYLGYFASREDAAKAHDLAQLALSSNRTFVLNFQRGQYSAADVSRMAEICRPAVRRANLRVMAQKDSVVGGVRGRGGGGRIVSESRTSGKDARSLRAARRNRGARSVEEEEGGQTRASIREQAQQPKSIASGLADEAMAASSPHRDPITPQIVTTVRRDCRDVLWDPVVSGKCESVAAPMSAGDCGGSILRQIVPQLGGANDPHSSRVGRRGGRGVEEEGRILFEGVGKLLQGLPVERQVEVSEGQEWGAGNAGGYEALIPVPVKTEQNDAPGLGWPGLELPPSGCGVGESLGVCVKREECETVGVVCQNLGDRVASGEVLSNDAVVGEVGNSRAVRDAGRGAFPENVASVEERDDSRSVERQTPASLHAGNDRASVPASAELQSVDNGGIGQSRPHLSRENISVKTEEGVKAEPIPRASRRFSPRLKRAASDIAGGAMKRRPTSDRKETGEPPSRPISEQAYGVLRAMALDVAAVRVPAFAQKCFARCRTGRPPGDASGGMGACSSLSRAYAAARARPQGSVKDTDPDGGTCYEHEAVVRLLLAPSQPDGVYFGFKRH